MNSKQKAQHLWNRLHIEIRFESFDGKHFKYYETIKLALVFLKNFETAFVQKIAATARAIEVALVFFKNFETDRCHRAFQCDANC